MRGQFNILTSNNGFADWGELLGDNVIATAILDRLYTTTTSSTSAERATDSRTSDKPDC